MIRVITLPDALQICDIYNYYVLNTTVTFEEDIVSPTEITRRIEATTRKYPWLVYESDGRIVAYASASEWKSRSAYRFSVESTVYLKCGYEGKGIGTQLYKTLLASLEKQNIRVVIGGIALPNEACISLHEKFGFSKVGHFKEVGFKFDKWIDVGYWEKVLPNAKLTTG